MAKLMNDLEGEYRIKQRQDNKDKIYTFDGNSLLQALAGLSSTFEDVTEKIFEILPKCDRYVQSRIYQICRKVSKKNERYLPDKRQQTEDWNFFLNKNENKKKMIRLIYR